MKRRLMAVAVTALLPAIAMLGYNEFASRRQRNAEVHEQAAQAAKQAASEVERVLDGMRSLLFATSAIPAVFDRDPATCGDTLKRVADKLEAIRTIIVLDIDGKLVCDSLGSPAGTDFSDRPYFREALASPDMAVGEYTLSRLSNAAVLPVALALRENDRPTGVIVTGVRVEWLEKKIEERGLLPGGAVTVADKNGTIVARNPFPERFIGKTIPSRYQSLLTAPTPSTTEIAGEDGRSRILGYEPISLPSSPLYVGAGIDKDIAFSTIDRATIYGIALILIGAAAALFAATYIGNRFILSPVGKIVATLGAWRTGNTSARVGLEGRHGDLTVVAEALDSLLDELDLRSEAAERLEETRSLLNRELSHRVKNTLAIVQAVARQSFWKSDPAQYQAFAQRLNALSTAHDVLVEGDWRSASLDSVILSTLRPYLNENAPQVTVKGPSVLLPAKAVLPMSLVMNELATNALKYGALSHGDGKVKIIWSINHDALRLTWKEMGGPPASATAPEGFGTKLIKRAFAAQYPADLNWDYKPAGLLFSLTVVLASEKEPALVQRAR